MTLSCGCGPRPGWISTRTGSGTRRLPVCDGVLEHLEADGPLTQRRLGDRLSLTSGAVTMLVDRSRPRGGSGPHHPSDRRSVLVELSAQAIERTPDRLPAYHARMREIADKVPAAERDAIRAFLQAAAEAASSAATEMRR
jgi:DNA-binding MarR family transcriptional regulator